MTIHPNPAHDHISVGFNSDNSEMVTITIIDTKGQTFFTNNFNLSAGQNNLKVDISGLPEGFYLVSLRTANELFKTEKFVKQ